MTAYYNEFKPEAAHMLRQLIKDGLIAAGDVDERSITEVKADDIKNYTQCHFFAGIGGGQLRSGSPDGVMIGPCGQEAAPANPSQAPVVKKAKQTKDTFGPHGSASSASYALQQSLESRLKAQLPTGGLTMFTMIWKPKVTPLGRRYCQLAQSASRTKENDCGLWHSPRSTMIMETPENFRARMNGKRANDRKDGLPNLAVQALWATPTSRDHKDGSYCPNVEVNGLLGRMVWNGSNAQTENKGQLNPAFVCWLMGYSTAHLSSMLSAMQSFRKSRRSSSTPIRSAEHDTASSPNG